MSDLLKPYPKYKDSGIPWLGKIPDHWDVRRNGRLFAQRNETGFGELPILEVSLRTGVRVRDMDNLKRKQVMSDAEKYKRAKKGDIAYNMMRMWQGALGTAPVDGLVSPAYVVARPFEETNPYYYSYLFRTEAYKAEVDGYSRGIVKDRNRLYWQDFKRMPSCFPPPDEQAAIVRFLDANAVLVRQFIRNRTRLIEVLIEQKQAIINRAVTRGLDSNTKMKPSGMDWLGDVPEHWEVVKFKYVASIRYGLGQPPKESKNGLPLLRATNVKGGKIVTKNLVFVDPEDVPASRDAFLRAGEILVVRSGALTADSAMVPEEYDGAVAGYDMVVNATRVLSEFLAAVLLCPYILKDQLYFLRSRAAQPHLNKEELGNAIVVLPTRNEQPEIIERVVHVSAEFDDMIRIIEAEMMQIREYRNRLIGDVIMGRFDIRGMDVPIVEVEPDCDILDDGSEDSQLDEEVILADD